MRNLLDKLGTLAIDMDRDAAKLEQLANDVRNEVKKDDRSCYSIQTEARDMRGEIKQLKAVAYLLSFKHLVDKLA
jgi:hypothetical protein